MSALTLHVASTSALGADGTVYQGLLRQDSTRGREVWRCGHQHPARPGARACARGELAQRALPEMRGNWGGTTQIHRDCLAPEGYRQVPVCRLCAKNLLHTQAEHERFDPLSRDRKGAST